MSEPGAERRRRAPPRSCRARGRRSRTRWNPLGKDARVRKRKQAASDRLNDACQDIEQCTVDIGLARASNSLDEEALDDSVQKLKASLEKLARETRRSVAEPGDGVAWLLDVISKGRA